MIKMFRITLTLTLLLVSVSTFASVLPIPDRGTRIQDIRFAPSSAGPWSDYDDFNNWYSTSTTTYETGPSCYAVTNDNDDVVKAYWKDVSYDALYGQVNNSGQGWIPADSVSRVDRGGGLYQIRVLGYLGGLFCCRAPIANVTIVNYYTTSSGMTYAYVYTQQINSAYIGNCI